MWRFHCEWSNQQGQRPTTQLIVPLHPIQHPTNPTQTCFVCCFSFRTAQHHDIHLVSSNNQHRRISSSSSSSPQVSGISPIGVTRPACNFKEVLLLLYTDEYRIGPSLLFCCPCAYAPLYTFGDNYIIIGFCRHCNY